MFALSRFQVEILEAAIRYIDSLHGQLVASVESSGLPTALRRQIEENQSGKNKRVDMNLFNRVGDGANGPENGLPATELGHFRQIRVWEA